MFNGILLLTSWSLTKPSAICIQPPLIKRVLSSKAGVVVIVADTCSGSWLNVDYTEEISARDLIQRRARLRV